MLNFSDETSLRTSPSLSSNVLSNNNIFVQLDGNTSLPPSDCDSVASDNSLSDISNVSLVSDDMPPLNNHVNVTLPTIATYNLRSLFPKIKNFKRDIKERNVDLALLSEVWEKVGDEDQEEAILKMCELDGLDYVSSPRGSRGGGVAIVVNLLNFTVERLTVSVPSKLDVVWSNR